MFSKLLRKVNAFLKNRPIREKGGLIPIDDDWWESLESRNNPWRTNAYWAVYRFFKNTKVFHPRTIYYDIKYFIQRGHRGWADCDTWSLDNYIDGWMPAALRHLKATKHGVPMQIFPEGPEYTKADGNPTEAAFDIAHANWDAILDKMIAGFEANNRMSDLLYEEELGSYPMERPKGVTKEEWKKVKDDHFKASQLLEERDRKIAEEGLQLFIKHYYSLWD